MFAELLSLTASQQKVLGMRIRPATPAGFEVLIWIGPTSGDRMEWHDIFSDSTGRAEGIDRVAAKVVDYCRQHGDCVGLPAFATESAAPQVKPALAWDANSKQ
jgi:hypothetical protein